jgi:hypothetical protein
MDSQIPSAEDVFQEEANHVLREGTYEFQLDVVIRELSKINKSNPTVSVTFKAVPEERLLEELQTRGYTVKFDTYYDSSKTEKYISKLRITNPKFGGKCNNFLENLEDQMKGFAFSSSGGFSLPEGTEEFLKQFSAPYRK